MGKALILRNVDFSNVAVDQIEIEEEVPCTGISLSASTASVDKIDDTVTITATLTPSNTTDDVIWTSSNNSVASVSGGVITVHGIGIATITATCGSASATVAVNQTTIKSRTIKHLSGKYVTAVNGVNSAAMVSFNSSLYAVGDSYNEQDTALHVIDGRGYNFQLFKMPYGATKTKLHTSDGSRIYARIVRCDCVNLATYQNVDYAAYLSETDVYITNDLTVSAGNAFAYRIESDKSSVADYVIYS